jgi:2-C-methyl-D-erythritol 4-phosphate cytidylyltransferase
MKVQAIIPAAGLGQRLKSSLVKALVPLQGRPLVVRTLEIFEQCALIDSILVAAPYEQLDDFKKVVKEYNLKKVKQVVPGGKRRCDSVLGALKEIDSDTQFIVIHDGARPFVTEQLLSQCIREALKSRAAIAAVPVKPTIKAVDAKSLNILKTLDRNILWEAQTPQVFEKELLVKAYASLGAATPTDDASLIEQLGIKVKIVEGQYQNIKITTPEDLVLAEVLLGALKLRK